MGKRKTGLAHLRLNQLSHKRRKFMYLVIVNGEIVQKEQRENIAVAIALSLRKLGYMAYVEKE
jgi:hypothetical protein